MPRKASRRTTSARSITVALIASLLSSLVTLAGILLSESDGLSARERRATVLFMLFALGGALLILFLVVYVGDLRQLLSDLRSDSAVVSSVPTRVRFVRRSDLLTVHPSGDAELVWDFELSSPGEEDVTELGFLVYAEIPAGSPSSKAVSVKYIEVDGAKRNTAGRLTHRWRREERPGIEMECSQLRVPVPLEHGRRRCRVKACLEFSGVFRDLRSREAFFVDIPYVTEQLVVRILSEHPLLVRRCATGQPHLEAMSVLMDSPDPGEVDQNASFEDGPGLTWEMAAPKLGYRYMIWFRIE